MAGRYALTEKDFLNEGADQILALGSRVIKLWFYPGQGEPPQKMYPFHSDWPAVTSLVDCAQTPYYRAVFAKPFTTFILTTARPDRPQGYWRTGLTADDEAAETRVFYELTKHFLTAYRDTGKTFVLQHWEGDWLVRGNTDSKQDPAPAALANMVRWLNARQAGVTQARQEVDEHGVHVFHAAEVNRVYDALAADRPTVINRVIPHTRVDLVSYSAYDTMIDHRSHPQTFRAALEFIAKHAPGGKASVYVGEFGCPENEFAPEVVEKTIADTVQTALGWGCRYIVYWELYCNELKNPATPVPVKKNEQMRGFWLIRPDGSKSWAWEYFHGLFSPQGRVEDEKRPARSH